MNVIKYFKLYLLIFPIVFILLSCENNEPDDVKLVKLGAIENEYIVDAEGGFFDIELYANGPYHIEMAKGEDWITLTPSESLDGKSKISVTCDFNEGFKRKAEIAICSDVDSRKDIVYVKQKSLEDAYIQFENSSIILAGAGGSEHSAIKTNIPFSDITVDINYSDTTNKDWLMSIDIPEKDTDARDMVLTYASNPNENAPRTASVSLSFTDGWGEIAEISFNILQRTAKEALGRQISFQEFRDKYSMGKAIEDYVILSGIVVSDTENRNAGENTQVTSSSIDYTISSRTVYFESVDGNYGVSILTSTIDDNVFEQYDKAQILLHGAVGKLVENPDRYEITGVDKSMIISRVSGSNSDVPVKERHIADLSDADIYTYVKLKDVEIPIRKGSLTPVNEGYAIGTNASRISKYPLLVRDINGQSIYLMTNTNCKYRSDGTRLPYGSGNISGVIVHERFSRFEWRNGADPAEIEDDPTLGFIGRYEIRPQTKNDIWGEMNDNVEDSFSALLTEYRYWNPDVAGEVVRPSYGTNGYFTHTYQEKYTGSENKEYTQATYNQHMWSAGTYAYLGPIGNNKNFLFGANYGNKNGIGIVIDPSKENWNSSMDNLVSHNPDGTIEWCGPYATDQYAANGSGGWPGNGAISTKSQQINYGGSTSMRGKGNVSGNCYTAFASHFWWDDDTDRPYAWLLNFSTEGISTDHISLQISVQNPQQSFYSPRFWCVEWAFTDSQDSKDDSQWHLIGNYTIPDVSVWSNTLYSSIVAFKGIDFELPLEILGHQNVYIRLRPTSDLCSDGSDYANAHLKDSKSGAALASEHASAIEYIAIRYNK